MGGRVRKCEQKGEWLAVAEEEPHDWYLVQVKLVGHAVYACFP